MPADDYHPSPEVLSERVRTLADKVRGIEADKASKGEVQGLREQMARLEVAVLANSEKVDRNTRALLGFSFAVALAIISAALGVAVTLGGVGQ